jgi:hypothetical protein
MKNLESHRGAFRYRTGNAGKIVEVRIDYELGRANWLTGKMNQRGLYVYVTPKEIEDGCERVTLCGNIRESGAKLFVRPLARKSDKQMYLAAAKLDPIAPLVAQTFETDPVAAFALLREKFPEEQKAAA